MKYFSKSFGWIRKTIKLLPLWVILESSILYRREMRTTTSRTKVTIKITTSRKMARYLMRIRSLRKASNPQKRCSIKLTKMKWITYSTSLICTPPVRCRKLNSQGPVVLKRSCSMIMRSQVTPSQKINSESRIKAKGGNLLDL